MACSIPSREPSKKGTEALCLVPYIGGVVKEGNRSIVLGSIWEPEHAVIVSLVDGFGPIKGPNDCGIGSSVVLALRPTTLTYSERREQFETYHHPLELAVVRELPASRYVSVVEGYPYSMSE